MECCVNNKELVSIIIPVYNVEKYLEKCIESVREQTYKHLEIILVDDGSNDGSEKICDLYAKKDSRVKVIHQKNCGRSAARNVGLDIASGEYLAFVDADDFVEKNYIEDLYFAIRKNNASISSCGYFLGTSEDGYIPMINKQLDILDHEETMCKFFYDNRFSKGALWSKLFRKSIVDKYNIRFDPKLVITQDAPWTCEYLLYSDKCVYVQKALYYYVYNEKSITRKIRSSGVFDKKNLITIEAHNKMELLIEGEKQSIKKALSTRFVRTYMRVFVNLYYSNTYEEELIKKINTEIRQRLKEFLLSPGITILERMSAILIAFNPKLYWSMFDMIYKIFRMNV